MGVLHNILVAFFCREFQYCSWDLLEPLPQVNSHSLKCSYLHWIYFGFTFHLTSNSSFRPLLLQVPIHLMLLSLGTATSLQSFDPCLLSQSLIGCLSGLSRSGSHTDCSHCSSLSSVESPIWIWDNVAYTL